MLNLIQIILIIVGLTRYIQENRGKRPRPNKADTPEADTSELDPSEKPRKKVKLNDQ
jgi:hypothetical protein